LHYEQWAVTWQWIQFKMLDRVRKTFYQMPKKYSTFFEKNIPKFGLTESFAYKKSFRRKKYYCTTYNAYDSKNNYYP
jgi:hypothetical protein